MQTSQIVKSGVYVANLGRCARINRCQCLILARFLVQFSAQSNPFDIPCAFNKTLLWTHILNESHLMKYFTLSALALPVLLAACATPQQRCINTASNTVRTLRADIKTAQGNVERGYAVHTSRESYQVMDVCYNSDGKPYPCLETRYRTVETPVAIDVEAERRKLAEYERRLPAAGRQMNAEISSCRLRFPDE